MLECGEKVSNENKYLLIKKIDEDSKTRTYLAEDLVLKRHVTFVQLKKSSSDKDGRNFLLHARMLGQLKHPGLLPLHDMGLHDERYFYTHRNPPGKALQSLILNHNKNGQRQSHLRAKSKQILYILSQITDAVSHLHGNGVTLGKLYSDSVYMGDFGEVIIKDFSKAQKFDNLKSEAFTKAKADDLQYLAHLGLRLWQMSPIKEKYSIREWDAEAQNLPLEFQDVLDRACLERGGKYSQASDFHEDLMNLIQGRPPKSKQNDIIFTLKGHYHKHRKASLAFLGICLLCTMSIAIKSSPLGSLNKDVHSLHIKIKENKRLSQLVAQEHDDLKAKFTSLNEQHQALKDRYQSRLNKKDSALGGMEKVQNELQQLNADIKKEQALEKSLTDNYEQILKKQQQLNERLQQLKNTQVEIEPLLSIDAKANYVGDYIIDYDTPKHPRLEKYFSVQLSNSSSWLNDLLFSPSSSPFLTNQYPLSQQSQAFSSFQGEFLAWSSSKNIHKLSLKPTPTLTSYPLIGEPLLKLAHLDSPTEMIGWNGREVYLIQESITGLAWSPPFTLEAKDLSFLGAHSSEHENSFQIWAPPKMIHLRYNPILKKFEDRTTSPPEQVIDIKVDSQKQRWALTESGIMSPERHLFFKPTDPLINWGLHHKDGVHVQTSEQLLLFDVSAKDESKKIWKISLASSNIISVVYAPDEKSCWTQTDDGPLQFWKKGKGKEEPASLPELTGQPLLYFDHTLVTKTDNTINCYRYPLQASLTLENKQLKQAEVIDPKSFIWREDGSDIELRLTNGQTVEAWDAAKNERLALLYISPTKLAKVMYSKRINAIIGLGENGKLTIL